MAVCRSKCN